MTKIRRVLMIIFLLLVCICFSLYIGNNTFTVTKIKYTSSHLPNGFDKYKIAHISDLHNKTYGKNNNKVIWRLQSEKPDLIVITGDLINADYYDENAIVSFLDNISRIAPVYYVTGNHEMANKNFFSLQYKLKDKDIKFLRNARDTIKRNGASITLIGIDDPISTHIADYNPIHDILSKEIDKALNKSDSQSFKILLSHRPEQFPLYVEKKIDLIFSGHAHGGQIRFPFLGSLFAPNQGFFPKYTSGKYSKESTTMIVSRGLGNGTIPLRIFNRPQIIITTLYKR